MNINNVYMTMWYTALQAAPNLKTEYIFSNNVAEICFISLHTERSRLEMSTRQSKN